MSANGKFILVVEDDDSIRMCLQEFLEQEGYEVRSAKEGNEAMGLLNSYGKLPDLIVADLIMPGMDGYSLVSNLRQAAEFKHIPIVVATAASIKEFGDVVLLKKPFDMDDLVHIIATNTKKSA